MATTPHDAAPTASSTASTKTSTPWRFTPSGTGGSDTQYPAPYVLTAPKVGGKFATRALKTNAKGAIAKGQMWQLISGVLP